MKKVMPRGVLYFNAGTRCLARLAVSLVSLRQVYDGPIALLLQEELPRDFYPVTTSLDVACHALPATDASPRTMKASLWRFCPFACALFLDADTLVTQNPTPLLDAAEQHGLVVTRFANWVTTGPRMRKRIAAWEPILGDRDLEAALRFGPAINTGVVGWRRDAPILEPWEALTRAGWEAGCTRRLIDEIACQVLLPRYPHHVVDDRWNWSIRHGVAQTPAILHYHGEKHLGPEAGCQLWRDSFRQLNRLFPGTRALSSNTDDKQLRAWLVSDASAGHEGGRKNGSDRPAPSRKMPLATASPRQGQSVLLPRTRDDLTIVTVVNPAYLAPFMAHWPHWMATEGLREQRYLILSVDDPDLGFLEGLPQVRILPWHRHGLDRRACLNAFVFGAAHHVQTAYWMKLDADARPVVPRFDWPDYRSHTLTAHRWGYTKVKGDPTAKRHWLNTLDLWWRDTPLFPPNLPIGRHDHPRIASFCSIEKTAFTQRLADKCGGELPIPSQDTTAWYAATRWGESILRINMKRQMRPT